MVNTMAPDSGNRQEQWIMINIEVGSDTILLKPILENQFYDVAGLFNCSGDIRYATGVESTVPGPVLVNWLKHLWSSADGFITGIYYMPDAVHIYDDSKPPVGMISGDLHDRTVWIKLAVILPQFRRRGIGSTSVELLLDYCKIILGVREALLSVALQNEAGMHFWLRQGFSESTRFEKKLFDDERPCEVIIMKKKL